MSGVPASLVLHVGMTKTGSTSIQHFLREHRGTLAEHGWLYPRTPGKARHIRLAFLTKTDDELAIDGAWVTGDYPPADLFRRRFPRRLLAEVADSGLDRVILSEESLFQSRNLHWVRERITSAYRSTKVVVYLRRQDDHLVSAYQQNVRGGGTLRIEEFATQRAQWTTFDYARRLAEWKATVGPDAVVVRPFESAQFAGGSLYQDFLEAAGVDLSADRLGVPPRRNESLDADAVEFVRIYNLHRIENEGLTPAQVRNGRISQRLAAMPGQGPTLTVSSAVLDDVMVRHAESNRAVARDYLGRPGELFVGPRRDGDTTTAQRLDPARVDAYLEALEIPEDQHAAIRLIAEREAGSPP